MTVNCGHDSYQCNSVEEFEDLLPELLSKDSAEIWISSNGGQDDYPCLVILVNENSATISHFGEDGSCYSSCNGSTDDGFITFCDEQYEIHSYQVISKEEVLAAALDFCRDKSRSNAVRWDQLY